MSDNKPYLNEQGDLVIPFACSEHEYKYWKKEGHSLADILRELDAPEEVWKRYTFEPREKDKPEQG